MSVAAIVAALAGLPAIIVIALQFGKSFGLSDSLVEPLAQLMGVLACVGYQLSVGVSPDLATAAAVGEIEGLAAMKLYDKVKGTFSLGEVVQAEPLLAEALKAFIAELGRFRKHNDKTGSAAALHAGASSAPTVQ